MTTRTHRVIIDFIDYGVGDPGGAPVVRSCVRRDVGDIRDYLLTFNSRTNTKDWGRKSYYAQLSKLLNYEEYM